MGRKVMGRVSVVVPNYNYGKYLKRRIWSILRQTYPIYELIILDDASTDGSAEIIKREVARARRKYPELKIEVLQNAKNSGKAMRQWKKGFEEAEGEFVWIAEADDLCGREFLAEAMKGFRDEKVMISYTESKIMNKRGVVVAPNFRWSRDREKTGHYRESYIKDGAREIEEIMAIRCTIPNVSAAVFRNEKRFLKYFDEALEFSQAGDWYFYAKILENGRIAYNRRALNKFRVHHDSKTGQAKKDKKHCKEVLRMHEYFRKKYNLNEEMLVRMKVEEGRIEGRMA